MKTQRTEVLGRMLEALRGNYTPRKGEIEGRYILSNKRRGTITDLTTKKENINEFGDLYISGSHGLVRICSIMHSNKEDQELIEAFVLLLEEEGLAKVDRILIGYAPSHEGMLVPKYTDEGISLIQEATATFYKECTCIWKKQTLINYTAALLNTKENIAPFKEKYRQDILNGIMRTEFNDDAEIEVIWANVINALMRNLSFTSKDKDFVKTVWEKTKTIPRGYLYGGSGTQTLLAVAIMEKDPKGIVEFEYISKRLASSNLSGILATIPVRIDNLELKPWQIDRHYPTAKVYTPIVKFIDRILSE